MSELLLKDYLLPRPLTKAQLVTLWMAISVSRCWNKKKHKFFQKLSKKSSLQFLVKIYVLNEPKKCPSNWATFVKQLPPSPFKIAQSGHIVNGGAWFQIRTSRDGSKTQVVRQYGCNTSSAGEPNQTMTYQQKSFVYINGAKVRT